MKRKITLILCYDVDNQNITNSLTIKRVLFWNDIIRFLALGYCRNPKIHQKYIGDTFHQLHVCGEGNLYT